MPFAIPCSHVTLSANSLSINISMWYRYKFTMAFPSDWCVRELDAWREVHKEDLTVRKKRHLQLLRKETMLGSSVLDRFGLDFPAMGLYSAGVFKGDPLSSGLTVSIRSEGCKRSKMSPS